MPVQTATYETQPWPADDGPPGTIFILRCPHGRELSSVVTDALIDSWRSLAADPETVFPRWKLVQLVYQFKLAGHFCADLRTLVTRMGFDPGADDA